MNVQLLYFVGVWVKLFVLFGSGMTKQSFLQEQMCMSGWKTTGGKIIHNWNSHFFAVCNSQLALFNSQLAKSTRTFQLATCIFQLTTLNSHSQLLTRNSQLADYSKDNGICLRLPQKSQIDKITPMQLPIWHVHRFNKKSNKYNPKFPSFNSVTFAF